MLNDDFLDKRAYLNANTLLRRQKHMPFAIVPYGVECSNMGNKHCIDHRPPSQSGRSPLKQRAAKRLYKGKRPAAGWFAREASHLDCVSDSFNSQPLCYLAFCALQQEATTRAFRRHSLLLIHRRLRGSCWRAPER